jgi:pyruvate formate lyase activating enzyme
MANLSGIVHSIESMTAVDGFGLRFLVFLQGCFRKCTFCSNPDTLELYNSVKRIPVNNIMKQIKNDYHYLRPNGGGLTVSGGDPLVQGKFVSELFKRTKDLGLTTCLDTSGFGRKEYYKDVVKYTDFTMLCIKSLNPKQHQIISGVDISHLQKFMEEIDNFEKQFRIRHVLITNSKYQTNDDDNIDRLVNFINKRKHCQGIEILPFHQLGKHKWEALDRRYSMNDVKSPTNEETQKFIEKLKKNLDNDKKIII